MKDTSRQPTTLKELEQLIQDLGEDAQDVDYGYLESILPTASVWLTWTYNFLSARKLYHKKAAMKTAILQRMAKTLLSKDELEAIDAEAEKQLVDLDQPQIQAIVGVCKEDNPRDVDEAYGPGTYARLFPSEEDE